MNQIIKKILTDKSVRTDEEAVSKLIASSEETFGPWLNEG